MNYMRSYCDRDLCSIAYVTQGRGEFWGLLRLGPFFKKITIERGTE